MKFYNLKFDCNTPTKQQINIPTNTDYKVGIKVTKNGKEVSPLPKNVKLGTLSADTEKTNGYITFTKSAGDDPSYIVEKLNIDEGIEYGTTQLSALGLNTTGATKQYNVAQGTAVSVEVPDEIVGQPLANAADLSVLWKNSTTEMTIEDAWDTYAVSLLDRAANIGAYAYIIGKTTFNGQPAFVTIPNSKAYAQYAQLAGFNVGDAIMLQNETGTAWLGVIDRKDFAFQEGDTIYLISQGNHTKNQYAYCGLSLQAGTPITAKFDLATNVFKSQQGDLDTGASSSGTVTLAGAYSDDTEFSYDLLKA